VNRSDPRDCISVGDSNCPITHTEVRRGVIRCNYPSAKLRVGIKKITYETREKESGEEILKGH
jgi:hypothetical protein